MKNSFLLSVFLLFICITGFSQNVDTGKKTKDTTVVINGVTVSGKMLQEEMPVGIYNQPEWTTDRRFSTTRIYLQQTPGTWGVEQWVKAQFPKKGDPNYLFQEEIELGLPGRFQLDLYENWVNTEEGEVLHDNISAELRWALAKWGKIPLNPTLYFEWKFRNPDLGPDAYELKVLLGKEFVKRWHWGLNVFYEAETSGELAIEKGLASGLSYTLKDKVLSAGLELKVESETNKENRNDPPLEIDLGPSIQWRPSKNTHLDIVPLIGLTKDSPALEAWFVFGVDFGKKEKTNIQAPVSTQSH